MLTRQAQKHTTYLTANATPVNPAFQRMRDGLAQTYAVSGAGPHLSTEKAYEQIERMIQGQATVLAYVDVLLVMTVMVACLVPMVAIMRRPKAIPKDATAMH
jgi:hypothetical protein